MKKLLNFFKWTAIVFAGLSALYVAAFAVIILWPHSGGFEAGVNGADYEQWKTQQLSTGADFSQDETFTETSFKTRDGETLYARQYGKIEATNSILLFMHGVADDCSTFNHAAGSLVRTTGVSVITPDLRGHGKSTGALFDTDYIGQYEDDLEDIILVLKKEHPEAKIFIGGHSMGGGVAIRYALKKHAPEVSGYVLFAPNFGDLVRHETPTPAANDAAPAEENPYVIVNTKRLIGQIFLGLSHINWFEHLPVVYFNKPPEYPAYSYTAIASAQPNPPDDASVALSAVRAPLIVVIGSWDEAFDAAKFQPLVSAHSHGEVHVIPETSHNSIANSPEAHRQVTQWFQQLLQDGSA